MAETVYLLASTVGIAFLLLMLALALFGPGLPYRVRRGPAAEIASEEFLRMLSALVGSEIHEGARVEVLTNGEVYYESELLAITQARHSVNMEAYIFAKGEVTRRFLAALTERARAGVQVNLVLDAIGSFATRNGYLRELREAGGRVSWYHPIRWHTLPRINNRTHRELIIVDGRVAFLGGAGFADCWRYNRGRKSAGGTPCSGWRATWCAACRRCSWRTGWRARGRS
jgi:cardiolipin synthase